MHGLDLITSGPTPVSSSWVHDGWRRSWNDDSFLVSRCIYSVEGLGFFNTIDVLCPLQKGLYTKHEKYTFGFLQLNIQVPNFHSSVFQHADNQNADKRS